VPMVLKWCVRGAALLLLIFGVLAAWSLSLRIGQYGLSADRIFAGLGVIVALAYGIGYSAAVFAPGRWMGKLEPLNIGLAIFKCALFIAVLTPIATPDRLSVNDQVGRLNAGKVSADKFDWWLLKDETGTYGTDALKKLASSTNPAIAAKAKLALEDKLGDRPRVVEAEQTKPPAQRPDLSRIPVVFPVGAKLPKSFLDQNFTVGANYPTPSCINTEFGYTSELTCKAALLDLNKDGQPEILIRQGPSLSILTFVNGGWVGGSSYIDMGGSEADFDAGKLRAAPSQWDDVMVGEARKGVTGYFDNELLNSRPRKPEVSAPSK
jgi:hypothetical protein